MNMLRTTIAKLAVTLFFCVLSYCLKAQKGFSPIPSSWLKQVFAYAVHCKQQNTTSKASKGVYSNEVIITVIRCQEPKDEKKIVQ